MPPAPRVGMPVAVRLARIILLHPDRANLPQECVQLAELILATNGVKHPDWPDLPTSARGFE